jgi:hypothetical protein
MSEGPAPKRPSALWLALVTVGGFAAHFGLDWTAAYLTRATRLLFWWGGATNFFYAINAQQAVLRIREAFDLVFYAGGVIALVAVMGAPLRSRLRLHRPGPGRLARYAEAHPVLVQRVLPWAAGFGWFAFGTLFMPLAWWLLFLGDGLDTFSNSFWVFVSSIAYHLNNLGYVVGSVAGIVGIAAAARSGVRALTRDPAGIARAPDAESEGRAGFAAVAVTLGTQGAVALLAALSIVTAALAATVRSNETVAPLVIAYMVVAMGAAGFFRRVSRISVGIDGIFVVGADGARFFGYADLDGVEARGGDVLLKRRSQTVLRLQLHDTDAGRAPELAARLGRAMDRAAAMRNDGADLLMQATRSVGGPSEKLASSARGGLDYREPAMAREQLWQLVEGPVLSAEARRVAAEALAEDLDGEERVRLRIAAERCADPRARHALERVLEEDEEEELHPVRTPRRAIPAG